MKMSDIFDLTNLLLLAVAVVIFLRLRSVLGRRTGADRARADQYAAAPRDASIHPLPKLDPRPAPVEAPPGTVDERVGSIPSESRALEPLRKIAAADPKFDTGAFLKGAKAAYEAIVSAYAHGDREALKNLLSPEVFDSFNSVIRDRETREETTEFSFVGIDSATIIDANIEGQMADVTVRFVSELVTAVRDKAGNVVEGDLKAVRQVTDIWTFARDVTSPNPNWRLVATDSPES